MLALGRCGKPSILRRMTAEGIGRRLERFPFPPLEARPTADRYATWPDQARLLCAGKLDELKALREKLVDELGPPGDPSPPASAREDDNDSAAAARFGWLFWLVLAFGALLLLAALLAGWIASRSPVCGCSKDPGPGIETVNLSADLLFDFKMSQPRSDVHRAKIVSDLRGLFHDFHGIRIVAVAAHTDPIGGTQDNQALGRARAATIRHLIADLINHKERDGQFAGDPLPPDQVTDGPGRDDAPFWRTCFTQYQLNVPKAQRPLVDLRPSKNTDHRVPCSQAGASDPYPYAACARPDVPNPRQRPGRGYAQRAENLRELTACLAPMRHVQIQFSYQRLETKSSGSNATSIPGAAK